MRRAGPRPAPARLRASRARERGGIFQPALGCVRHLRSSSLTPGLGLCCVTGAGGAFLKDAHVVRQNCVYSGK